LPCYRLRIGRDVGGIPLAIEALLVRVAREGVSTSSPRLDVVGTSSERAHD
jgi:hypothetical protein